MRKNDCIALLALALFSVSVFLYYFFYFNSAPLVGQDSIISENSTSSENEEGGSTTTLDSPVLVSKENNTIFKDFNIVFGENYRKLETVDKDGIIKPLVIPDNKDFIFGEFSVSPDGKYLVYTLYDSEQDGSLGKYDYLKTGLSLMTLSDQKTTEIFPRNMRAYTDIHWSADGKYFSYLVNGGASIEIKNSVTHKTVLTIPSPGSRNLSPLVWIDNERFSFISENSLYSGTLQNPKERLIASDVDNGVAVFEGASYIDVPKWSDDGQYVAYFTQETLKVLDTLTNKQYKLGRILNDCSLTMTEDCSFPSIYSYQWFDSVLYYIENDTETSNSLISDITKLKYFNFVSSSTNTISEDVAYGALEEKDDSDYISFYDNASESHRLYDTKNHQVICQNELARSDFVAASHLFPEKAIILRRIKINPYPNSEKDWESILSVINLKTCVIEKDLRTWNKLNSSTIEASLIPALYD